MEGKFEGLFLPAPPKRDPSLGDQLKERKNLLDSVKLESYLEAVRKAPGASSGTRKKWKRSLGF